MLELGFDKHTWGDTGQPSLRFTWNGLQRRSRLFGLAKKHGLTEQDFKPEPEQSGSVSSNRSGDPGAFEGVAGLANVFAGLGGF